MKNNQTIQIISVVLVLLLPKYPSYKYSCHIFVCQSCGGMNPLIDKKDSIHHIHRKSIFFLDRSNSKKPEAINPDESTGERLPDTPVAKAERIPLSQVLQIELYWTESKNARKSSLDCPIVDV